MTTDFNVKYRPQTVFTLDLAPLRESLSKVLKSGRIPHAFLFAGPRGTGKTSAARIVAKAVNCTGKKKDFEPCNQCQQCQSITAGANLDVLEIDAASSRGIDDIRELREKIRLAPSSSAYKVYIIDEVQMLTIEAFNALLKTLEEPPEHAIFILCTTAPEKLPDTIVSRCMRFNFRRATKEEIMAKLQKIAKFEKIKIEEKALSEIARAVKGSFRDANRILEQASLSGEEVREKEIKKILDQALGLEPENLFQFLVKKDAKGGIEEIGKVVETGGNLRVYTQELLELLRQALLVKVGAHQEEPFSLFDIHLPRIEEIKRMISCFSRAARQLRESFIPQLPLEMAVVDYCLEDGKVSLDKFSVPVSQETKEEEEVLVDSAPYNKEESSKRTSSNGNPDLLEIKKRWQEVLLGVRPKNHSVEALLRATRPIELEENRLIIEVFYQFHKDRLEEEKCRLIIEEVVKEVFGQPFFIKCILGERRVKKNPIAEEIEAIKAAAPTPEDQEVFDEDIVSVAEEIFNGKRS